VSGALAIPPWLALPPAVRMDLVLAVRNITRQRRRSALALVAVAFGVAANVLAAGFIEWTLHGMREETIRSQTGHLQVAMKGFFEAGASSPRGYLIAGRQADDSALRRFPGVVEVAPRVSFTGLASLGDATLSFLGEGMDPAREKELGRSVQMVDGRALDAEDPRGVILGQGLATNLGAKVGDTVVLLSTTVSGNMSGGDASVRGIFSTVSKSYDDHALRAPIAFAQQLLKVNGIQKWVVLLEDTGATSATRTSMGAALAPRGFEVVPWYEFADFYVKTETLFRKQVSVVETIIALIIILSISNTLAMAVMERTAEIGTSLALGLTRRRIVQRFVIEGVVLGLVGGVLGALIGTACALVISAIGIPMPPPPGMARGYTAEIAVGVPLFLEVIGLALATAFVASLYPAWKASRLPIVDALRHSR